MRFSFNTDQLEPAARFEAFRDQLVRRLFQLDLVNRADGAYRGIVDLDVCPVVFGRVFGSPADFKRTPQVARQCEDGVWLLLARGGRMGVAQADVSSVINPGEGMIYDARYSHEGHCLGQTDTWVIQVRDDVIDPLRARRNGPRSRVLTHATATYVPLLLTLMEAHFRLADPNDADASRALGRYLSELVALQLGAHRDAIDAIARSGLMAARRQAILDQIERHATDPAFNADAVARRLGISRRYVNILMEETGRTFAALVLERRLTVVRRLLADPDRQAQTIAQIAYDCGFGDLSYFNRAFRRRFGDTPGSFRRR
jgi:AraC-like DNA-binding protein